MNIVTVGLESDLVLVELERLLTTAGARVIRLDPHGFALGDPMLWDGEGFLAVADDVSQVDAIVVRRLPAERSVPPRGTSITAEQAEHDGTAAMERAHFFGAWLWDAEQRGVPVYNPRESQVFDQKPLQLAMLHRAGVPLPRTLITNSAQAMGVFADAVGEVIFKPVGGGRETELLTPEARGRLQNLSASPVIFQQRIIGPDLRVTVVGGRVVSQVEIPSHPVDYRLGADYRAGNQRYVEVTLPAEVQALAVQVAALCRQTIAGIDLKRDEKNGQYYVLESNSAPVYLDIERKLGHPISETLAELVLSRRHRFV